MASAQLKSVTKETFVQVSNRDFDEATGELIVNVRRTNVVGLRLHMSNFPAHDFSTAGGSFVVTASGTSATRTVVGGQYTAAQLASHLQAIMGSDFTVSFNTISEKFTFVSSAAAFSLKFNDAIVGYQLGFGTDTISGRSSSTPTVTLLTSQTFNSTNSGPYTLISPFSVDLLGARFLEIALHNEPLNTGDQAAVEHAIGKGTVIEIVHLSDDANIHVHSNQTYDLFAQPTDLMTFTLSLKARLPTGQLVTYNSRGRSFHMYFTVLVRDLAWRSHGINDFSRSIQ